MIVALLLSFACARGSGARLPVAPARAASRIQKLERELHSGGDAPCRRRPRLRIPWTSSSGAVRVRPVLRLGWLAARIDINSFCGNRGSCRALISRASTFLLNEQPKSDRGLHRGGEGRPETASCTSRWGACSAARETERAIRMHRNLLERPDLGGEQRLTRWRAGQDYLKAGLLEPRGRDVRQAQGSRTAPKR